MAKAAVAAEDASRAGGAAWSPAGRAAAARIRSSTSSRRASAATASCSRAAALPVGAASATSGSPPFCSASSARMRATVVVLPVPGPPATTAKRRRTADAAARLCAAAGLVAEHPREARARARRDRRPRPASLPSSSSARGHLHLLGPVAVEVQPRALEAQRTHRCAVRGCRPRPAANPATLGDPIVAIRPRERAEVDRLVGVDGSRVANLRQIDEHVPDPRRADRQRNRQQHPLVALAGDRAKPASDVDVGRGQHAGEVELAQQPRGVLGVARLERVTVDRGGRAHRAPRRSRSRRHGARH